jgi:hypothetical protein
VGFISSGASQFDSDLSGEKLMWADNPLLNMGTLTTGFSLRLWYQMDSLQLPPNYLVVISNLSRSHWASSDFMLYRNSGEWRARMYYDGEVRVTIPIDDNWHRLIVTYHKPTSTLKMRLDMDPIGAPQTNTGIVFDPWGDQVIYLGTLGSNNVPGLNLDEIAFWRDYILTEDDMLADWNGGAGLTYPPL